MREGRRKGRGTQQRSDRRRRRRHDISSGGGQDVGKGARGGGDSCSGQRVNAGRCSSRAHYYSSDDTRRGDSRMRRTHTLSHFHIFTHAHHAAHTYPHACTHACAAPRRAHTRVTHPHTAHTPHLAERGRREPPKVVGVVEVGGQLERRDARERRQRLARRDELVPQRDVPQLGALGRGALVVVRGAHRREPLIVESASHGAHVGGRERCLVSYMSYIYIYIFIYLYTYIYLYIYIIQLYMHTHIYTYTEAARR